MKSSAWLLGLFGLLAVTALPTSSAHAQATRTWVSGVGDDVNPCSRTAPCKTFAGAISKTAAGGEINCLDPGGFGAVTITKSITLDCIGTLGSILSSGVNGINVNDSATATPGTIDVIVRNLSINGAGTTLGVRGINFTSGRSLSVENVTIDNFSNSGIDVNLTRLGLLTVRNVTFHRMPAGIKLATTTNNAVASITDSKFFNNVVNGVDVGARAFATVSNSVFAALNGTAILASTATSTAIAKNNIISNSAVGISANVSGAKIRANGNGLYSNGKAFNVGAGGSFLTGNGNEIDVNPGDASTGLLTFK